MRLSDLDRIIAIECMAFSAPWSRMAFQGELGDNQFAHYIVALTDGMIVGYAGMWMIIDEAHITTIAVSPDYQGQGIGEMVMRQLIGLAVTLGCLRMTLEVRVSNYVAQKLYEKLGFVSYGLRPGYYSDNNEDALIMWLELVDFVNLP